MFFLLILVSSIVLIVKVASAEDRSPVLWGIITFVTGCILVLIPIPLLYGLTPVIPYGIIFFLNMKSK